MGSERLEKQKKNRMYDSFIHSEKILANQSTKIGGGPNDWQETEKLKKKGKKGYA